MIPKIIHYCWFGNNTKSPLINRCIDSWEKYLPDYTIKEWNESNFEIQSHPFSSRMYKEKKWAFVADYVRLHVLKEYGGIYLDTDMLILKPLEPLLTAECILGEESPGVISAGMIGASPNHPFIIACKKFYDKNPEKLDTIPRILTQIFNTLEDKTKIKVFPPNTFYPFDAEHIKNYYGQDLGDEVYGVHLWNYSWGHPLNKLFKKIGVYSFGKKIAEILGIKKILKRLFGFI